MMMCVTPHDIHYEQNEATFMNEVQIINQGCKNHSCTFKDVVARPSENNLCLSHHKVRFAPPWEIGGAQSLVT